MIFEKNATVGSIAATMPEALPVFQRFGIDFCCGGKRPLAAALAEKHVGPEQFSGLLEAERTNGERREKGADFNAMSPAVLCAYIEDTHHDYLRRALPEIGQLTLAVLRAHGRNHRELFEVYRLFGRLKTDLEQHLVKEETILFPALAKPGTPEKATRDLAADIIGEHEAAGKLLRELHRVTVDFTVPSDACESYRKVYALLPELENDLHRHIHLENNILMKNFNFPQGEAAEDGR
ncbi:iron-sulfur cluster repair di-iron protein [Caproicibacterium sp. BJN0003]|uniref:iron-sulfur cluster repair di-iron protein n=1 Tax=Caproicibacterium sp. BJN0003 TaxID=2994078 RepID=UPI002259359E|nr:iron-sulfur cluster repair di-iron protein [Caproicibacterium sp. BJN0003]UZT81601.1 iron-sulfur cluster repair di-iron protein [Caproicibacterium sp. BJN0003]